ncbi:ATP-binding cassette subfamily B protein [Azospirillaceae bacterium]
MVNSKIDGEPAGAVQESGTAASVASNADVSQVANSEPVRMSGLEGLVLVARHHGINTTVAQLVHNNALPPRDVLPHEIPRLARTIGMKARKSRFKWEKLISLNKVFPLLLSLNNKNTVIMIGIRRDTPEPMAVLVDPLASRPEPFFVTREQLEAQWSGDAVLLRRTYDLTDSEQPFGLRWFIPEMWLQRAAFRDVAIAAVVLHVISLATPMFFQLILDRVMTHQSYSSLYVLSGGIIIVIIFEAAFSFVRRFLLLFASNRIDIRLATRTFSHLVSLPIDYFEQTSAGITVRYMQQVEKIRQFLTGRLLLTALDATALIVFFPILLLYSVRLTLVVLLFTALMALVIFLMLGPFRQRLKKLSGAESERQAMLVETIHGMRTIKSSAIEPIQRRKWEQSAANVIKMQFQVGEIGAYAQAVMHALESLMKVAVVGVGTSEVFDQTLTAGALIAFQMVSGRVVSPLVQIVSLVQDYQETLLSVEMLSKIMNRPPERRPGVAGLCPTITGKIDFDGVRFRYGFSGPPVLDGINLHIPAGAVVGLVGRSGSGKTTLTRLIQGFYPVQEGVLRFDGVDIREIDLPHLRRSLGVVLQDNFLFRGTVRDNIAITRPEATLEEIIRSVRLAGADEFIEKLPLGLDTMIEENASNFSGGQRQRLAIARALLPQPRLLILDEATSALDPDSEAIFMANLAAIASGRTVLLVSHRLTTLVRCNAILVMDRGRIVDAAPHADLLGRCDIYRHLWTQQNHQ